MKYFAIEYSLDEKIVGKIPQAKDFEHHCNVVTEPSFIDRLFFRKIVEKPILSNVILQEKANQTDLINTLSSVGFSYGSIVISNKLKVILEQFNCYGLQYFSTYIVQKNQKFDNYWQTHIYEFAYQYIDFNSTTFKLKDRDCNRNMITKDVKFNDMDEFLQFTDNIEYPKMLSFNAIFFNKNINLDFFSLRYDEGIKGIVSERLKNEIEKQEITGIEFRPIELSLQEWYSSGAREKIYGKV